MNDPLLQPWLAFEADGSILCSHCTCMAGLGEVCSHTAAIAFALYYHAGSDEACTDRKCMWSVPRAKKNIEAKRIKDINFGKQTTSFNSWFSIILVYKVYSNDV